jgi:predicted AlkP superfamily pyrophosphatase or phosphodiesterase
MIHLYAKWKIEPDGTRYVLDWSKQVEQLTPQLQDKLFSYFPNVLDFDFTIEYFYKPKPIPHEFTFDLIEYFSERDEYIAEYFTH